jgi:predicted anti-sigma-YlaC factor YlaD
MTCEGWQELILDRKSLDEAQRQDLDQHLPNCIHCSTWAKALAEMDATMTEKLNAEVNPLALRRRVLYALARERRQNWMAAVPDVLDVLGWGAVVVIGMVSLLLSTNWASRFGNHIVSMGVAALVGSMAWAASVLWKEESEARPLL